jgi:hypothetical protein
LQSAAGLGMGATRVEERLMCAMGLSDSTPVSFESCETLPCGGVMFVLPFLLESGLLSYSNHYRQRKGYYSFNTLFIILAFCFLCRIKSIEQIKQYAPGEFGKLVGYDRIPEVRTIRYMVKEITEKKSVDQWVAELSRSWIEEETPELYYIDGHVQVYHGELANLGKKHVSRQRLCLPGMMEFWVNAKDGNPYFFITAQVNEKMMEIIENEIIPQLLKLHAVSPEHKQQMAQDPNVPLFTLVFDRESWSPDFFSRLWKTYRIAIITYRKNVKDKWNESLFSEYPVKTFMGEEKIKLHEQAIELAKCPMREVRKLGNDGHQTSIVTTHPILTIAVIASNMFARWGQENFFSFMRQNYAIDKIIQYSIDEIDKDFKVVNQEYNNITYRIKKENEKLSRRAAKLYEFYEKNPLMTENENENENKNENEKGEKKWMKKSMELFEEIQKVKQQITELINKRKEIPYKITVGQMPQKIRYNKLNRESKVLMNVLKMICYRAETALARLLEPHFKRSSQEVRMLIKSLIRTPVNLKVDRIKKELNITLYPLSNQRSNEAICKICDTLNETNTIFPDTNLMLNYKIATINCVPNQEF